MTVGSWLITAVGISMVSELGNDGKNGGARGERADLVWRVVGVEEVVGVAIR